MGNFDDLKLAVESISGGRNTVKFDDLEMPSIVVPFPKLKYSDIMAGGTQDTLPAFIVDGVEKNVIFESKYQNIVMNDRAYSLPFKDPKTYIDFDTAVRVCKNKGAGWHLHSNALWAAIQNWCYKNGTVPHGNNNYGCDINNSFEKGVMTYMSDATNVGRIATGSGPVTWYHNYDSSGIADLNGNVWEWVAGFRLVSGEIQIIPYGNCMKSSCNMSATSTEWKAILQDGSLVDPGTANTLKFDRETATSGIRLNTATEFSADGSVNKTFKTLTAKSGVTLPQLLKGLGIIPIAENAYGGDNIWMNNVGERLALRGSVWYDVGYSGLSALNLDNPRSGSGHNIGFRAALIE